MIRSDDDDDDDDVGGGGNGGGVYGDGDENKISVTTIKMMTLGIILAVSLLQVK